MIAFAGLIASAASLVPVLSVLAAAQSRPLTCVVAESGFRGAVTADDDGTLVTLGRTTGAVGFHPQAGDARTVHLRGQADWLADVSRIGAGTSLIRVINLRVGRVGLAPNGGGLVSWRPLPSAVVSGTLASLGTDGSWYVHGDAVAQHNGESPLLAVSPDGNRVDTLAWAHRNAASARIDIGGVSRNVPAPFEDDDLVATSSSGHITAVVQRRAAAAAEGVASFRVIALRKTGDTLYSRSVEYAPKRASAKAIDDLVSEEAGHLTEISRLRTSQVDSMVRRAVVGKGFLPPVTAVFVTANGDVWLQRERLSNEAAVWTMMGPGDRRAEWEVPAGLFPFWFGPATVLARGSAGSGCAVHRLRLAR